MTSTSPPLDETEYPAPVPVTVTDASPDPALQALAGGEDQPTARFRYDVLNQTWWWSPALYTLHGLTPDEVSPSTELLLAHKHQQDRRSTEDTLRGVLATGEPFCCRHRIVDAQGRVHTVLSLGEGVCDESGAVVAVNGYFVDVTRSLGRDIERETREAVTRSAETRALIEQAKGLLIAGFRIDAQAAFELLTWFSQHTNVKVRVLAADLVDLFAKAPADGLTPARRVRQFVHVADEIPVDLDRSTAPGTG